MPALPWNHGIDFYYSTIVQPVTFWGTYSANDDEKKNGFYITIYQHHQSHIISSFYLKKIKCQHGFGNESLEINNAFDIPCNTLYAVMKMCVPIVECYS